MEQSDQQSTMEQEPSLREAIFMQGREARLMLIIGVANGAIIGVFFLVYLVIAVVSGEQTSFSPGS